MYISDAPIKTPHTDIILLAIYDQGTKVHLGYAFFRAMFLVACKPNKKNEST